MNKNNIDIIFNNGLSNYTEQPPAHIWDSVESHMDNARKKRTAIILWRATDAAAVVCIVFLSSLYFNTLNTTSTVTVTNNIISPYQSTPQQAEQINNSSSRSKNLTSKHTLKHESQLNSTQQQNTPNNYTLATIKHNNKTTKLNTHGSSNIQASYTNNPLSEVTKIAKQEVDLLNNSPIIASYILYSNNNVNITRNAIDLIFGDDFSNTKKEKAFTIASIGGQLSPSYANKYSSKNEAQNESGLTSLTGGLNLNIKTRKKWQIETGLYFAQIGQKFSNSSEISYDAITISTATNTTGTLDMQNSLGEIYLSENIGVQLDKTSSSIETFDSQTTTFSTSYDLSIQQELNYLKIPFLLRYNIIEKEYIFAVKGGVSSNFLIGNNVYDVSGSSKNNIGSTANINSFCYTTTVGFGFKTPIYKSFEINMEPQFSYYANSISNASNYDYKPYSIGIFTGISYQFK